MDILVNLVGIAIAMVLLFGGLLLMATRPKVILPLTFVLGYLVFGFFAWGGWVLAQDFGWKVGGAMFVIGSLGLAMLTLAFIEEVVRPTLRRLTD